MNFYRFKLLFLCLVLAINSVCFADGVVTSIQPDIAVPRIYQPTIAPIPNVPNANLINIVAPDQNGLSHNKYKEFNTSAGSKTIFNNSLTEGQSVLGGLLQGNPNFSDRTASTILNEITWVSGNPSQLNGFFEIFGDRANLIWADPNGIFIGGASQARFINVNNLSFFGGAWNGTPTGNIGVGQYGLNASDSKSLNFYSKDFFNGGTITGPKADSDAKPYQMVDINTLPGMSNVRPGRIFVPVDSEGNILGKPTPDQRAEQIAAIFNDPKNKGSLRIKATGQLVNQGNINTSNNLEVSAGGNLTNQGTIQAGQDAVINGDKVKNSPNSQISSENNLSIIGSSLINQGNIQSGNNLTILMNGSETSTRQRLDNRFIHIANADPIIPPTFGQPETLTTSIWNQQGGSITSGGDMGLYGKEEIRNTGADIFSDNLLFINGKNFVNEGTHSFWTGMRQYQGTGDLAPHHYTEWTDFATNGISGYLGSAGSINMELQEDFLNKNSQVETGGNFIFSGRNFTNQQTVLEQTLYDTWIRGGLRRRRREVWTKAAIGVVPGSIYGEGNYFNPEPIAGNFNSNAAFDFKGNVIIDAKGDIKNGIDDQNVLTPRLAELPDFIALPDINGIRIRDPRISEANRGRELSTAVRVAIANATGRSFIGGKFKSPEQTLAELDENTRKAMQLDPGMIWGKALTQEQINNLSAPILWEVGGKTVIYFSKNVESKISPEGRISGENIALSSRETIKNTGTVEAKENLVVSGKEIINESRIAKNSERGFKGRSSETVDQIQTGGTMTGRNVSLTATDSITNRGGLIEAEQNLNANADKITNTVQRGTSADKDSANPRIEFQGGIISSTDGEVNLTGQEIRNQGSAIIAEGDVNIKGEKLVENTWVKDSYKVQDNRRGTRHEHVTQAGLIGSNSGDINISTNGDFNNTASDLLAERDINVSAENINITDDVLQTTETRRSSRFSVRPTGINYSRTRQSWTQTTHRESNLLAGGNINLNANEDINFTGSNAFALDGRTSFAAGDDINIQAGEYINRQSSSGFSVGAGWQGGSNLGVSASAFRGRGSQTILTPSNIYGSEGIDLRAGDQLNIIASNARTPGDLNIEVREVNLSGRYAPYSSRTNAIGGTIGYDLVSQWNGSVGVGTSWDRGADYFSTNLTGGQGVNINSPTVTADGTNINGVAINPHGNWRDSGSQGIGLSLNARGGAISLSNGDSSFFIGGGSNGLTLGGGYQGFIAGSSFGSGGITPFAGHSMFGTVGTNFSLVGNSSRHLVVTPNFNILGFNGGVSFSDSGFNGYTLNFGQANIVQGVVNNFNYTCFPAGTKITAKGGNKNIEEIKVDDEVLSKNLETGKLEWKPVVKTFIRQAEKLLVLSLSNGRVIKPTPDHEFWLAGKGEWIEAGKLKVNDKLLDEDSNEVSIISINEEAGATVYNFTVKDNHNYFAEEILVHNTDYSAQQTQELRGGVEQTVLVIEIHSNDQDLIDRNLADLQRLVSTTTNFSPVQQTQFQNQILDIRREVRLNGGANESTQQRIAELGRNLDQALLVNAIQTGNFNTYNNSAQRAEVAGQVVESLREQYLSNPSPGLLTQLNKWEQKYNDLRNQSVNEVLAERREQELFALNTSLLVLPVGEAIFAIPGAESLALRASSIFHAIRFGSESFVLPEELTLTFQGGKYTPKILQEDTILYRAGSQDYPLGQFFSQDIPLSEVQVRIDKAILPRWSNGGTSPIDTVYQVKIPKGTVVFEGNVGYQGGFYQGGTQQIVVPAPWNIPGVKVMDSWKIFK